MINSFLTHFQPYYYAHPDPGYWSSFKSECFSLQLDFKEESTGAKRSEETEVEAASAQPRLRETTSVLVVDDDDQFRRALINSLIELSGAEIEAEGVESGEMAMQILEDGGSYKRIFLDLTLPGMDGLETYTRISETNPSVGITLMTSDLDSLTARTARARGLQVIDKNRLRLELISLLFGNHGEPQS